MASNLARDSSEDFFNNALGGDGADTRPAVVPAKKKMSSPKRRPPPPPPPRKTLASTTAAPAAPAPSAASSYYGSGGGTSVPPPAAAAPAATMSSYYGNTSAAGPSSSGAPPAAAGGGASSSYYSSASTATAPRSGGAALPPQQDDWFTASNATSTSSAPSSATAAPSVMNPYAPQPAPAAAAPTAAMPNTWMQQQQQPVQQQQQQQQPTPAAPAGFSGTIMSGAMTPSTTNTGTAASGYSYNPNSNDDEDYENEPPLMEELGINVDHILTKSLAVVVPTSKFSNVNLDRSLMEDADMIGPLAFALLLGGELLLSGKIHFGYIYGFGMTGCLALSLVLNLMSPTDAISVWTVISILGYALLPVNALAGINILFRIQRMGIVGMVLSVVTILWCTVASTRLFERGCGLRDQRYLVAYPVALLYSAFVMITIF